jgi:hypothetical protein
MATRPCVVPSSSTELILDIAQSQLSMRGVPPRSQRRRVPPTPDEEVEALAQWICERTHKVVRGEYDLTFRELRQILRQFDYDFDSQKGGLIDVVKACSGP